VQPGTRPGPCEVVALLGIGSGEFALHMIRTNMAAPLKRGATRLERGSQ
jgi:hypothetical protein